MELLINAGLELELVNLAILTTIVFAIWTLLSTLVKTRNAWFSPTTDIQEILAAMMTNVSILKKEKSPVSTLFVLDKTKVETVLPLALATTVYTVVLRDYVFLP